MPSRWPSSRSPRPPAGLSVRLVVQPATGGPERPATELDLAVELVNTVWVLASPPDRLTDIGVYRAALHRVGEGELADGLGPRDLGPLRDLRERLRPVFDAHTPEEAAALVNVLLSEADAVPQLVSEPAGGDIALAWGVGRRGFDALAARLSGALATHIATSGISRLGICAAPPCNCVFVDRTRPRTRKYCCDRCNDRAAAAAYYKRNHPAAGS